MSNSFDYSALFGGGSGISSDAISAWYQTRSAQAQISSANLNAALLGIQNQKKVTPPWDTRLDQPTPDERLRAALSGASFVDENAAKLSDPDASVTDQKLFALYNALAKLSAIANNAATKSTPETMLGTLNSSFQDGLAEILAYAKTIDTDELAVVGGEKASKLDAGVLIPRSLSQYTTKIIHRALPTDAMAGIAGTEKFMIAVTKGGVTTNVDIDLSELGTSSVSLDSFIDFVNDKLAAAGMVSRFKRVRLDTLNADGTAKSPPPQTWGLTIQGTSTERLSFSAQGAGRAVYLAGNSGKPGDTAAQMIKLDLTSGSPVMAAGDRIEAEGVTADASHDPITSDNDDGDVQATIAKFNDMVASATGSKAGKTVMPPTTGNASALDADGNLYIVGTSEGSLGNDVLQGEKDVFLTKYDSTGQIVWQRMIGNEGSTEGAAVAVDASGNVVIAGKTTAGLNDGEEVSQSNSFVTKYDRYGQELFTRDVGPVNADAANALVIGADGSIYLGGQTKGALASGLTAGGGTDGYITKLSSTGTLVYNRQIGGAGEERITSLALDGSGNLVALSMESGHAIVRKYDASNGTASALWQADIGDLKGGEATSIGLDGTTTYIAGWTNIGGIGTGQGGYQGGSDGFVVTVDDTGTVINTNYVATFSTDRIRSMTVSNGEIYIAGDTTGDLSGDGFSGTINGFAAKLDVVTGLDWIYQYAGRNGYARVNSVQADQTGSSILDTLGLPKGRVDYTEARTITAQSTVRPGQEFFISVNGGAKRRIKIDLDDTLNALVLKINAVLVLDGKARVRRVSGGSALRIEGKLGSRIDLIAGAEGKDALKGLGLSEGSLIVEPPVAQEDEQHPSENANTNEEKRQTFVGLGLASDLKISSHDEAAHVNGLLQDALSALRKAFRELNPDLTLEALSKLPNADGPVPSYLSAQIANYRNGLARLLGGGSFA